MKKAVLLIALSLPLVLTGCAGGYVSDYPASGPYYDGPGYYGPSYYGGTYVGFNTYNHGYYSNNNYHHYDTNYHHAYASNNRGGSHTSVRYAGGNGGGNHASHASRSAAVSSGSMHVR